MAQVTGIYCDAEHEKFYAALWSHGKEMQLLWRLGCHTGIRISDILRLTAKSTNGAELVLIESKTGKKRKVSLSEDMWDDLDEHVRINALKDNDRLFPITRMTVHRYITATARFLGLNFIGCHSMRKIFAWSVYRNTGDVKAVKAALNHKYLSTTMLYLLDGMRWSCKRAYGDVKPFIEPSKGA